MKKSVVSLKSKINPWEVSNSINYDRLVKEFGTSKISKKLQEKFKGLHPLIKNQLYFSHRDLDSWISDAESKKEVSIITGRGPSEKMHLGHLVPFLVAKSLQDKYNCNVYIPISDDEKFFVKPNLSFQNALEFGEDNILDIIALGFKPEKTFIFQDFVYTEIYKLASRVAKTITYSTAKAAFGLKSENNIGWSFYPAMQAAHILFPQIHMSKAHTSLVPVGIDQDPFIRLTRDIASHPSLGLKKPAAIHAKFLPSLKGDTKMSSSHTENEVIYLSDDKKTVESKIKKYAFSGGQKSLEEHKKLGGNPDIDVSFLYLKYLFIKDEKELSKIEKEYRSGKLLTSKLKKIFIKKTNEFLSKHQSERKKAKAKLSKFLIS
jgi:tryptophanyl-tRNA synthetase